MHSISDSFTVNIVRILFSYSQDISPGLHSYKFIVDSELRFAPDQPFEIDSSGNITNTIQIFRKKCLPTSSLKIKEASETKRSFSSIRTSCSSKRTKQSNEGWTKQISKLQTEDKAQNTKSNNLRIERSSSRTHNSYYENSYEMKEDEQFATQSHISYQKKEELLSKAQSHWY